LAFVDVRHAALRNCALIYDIKVPGPIYDLDFMVKDAKRFPDSGGWGYAVFVHDTASDRYTPAPWPTSRRKRTTLSVGPRAIPL